MKQSKSSREKVDGSPRLITLLIRELTRFQIAYMVFLFICLLVIIAGMLMAAAKMAADLGWPISLFGWTVPTGFPGIWDTLFWGLCIVAGFNAIFGETIKNLWENRPKSGAEAWTEIRRLMREHKLITALVGLALLFNALGWLFKFVAYLLK